MGDFVGVHKEKELAGLSPKQREYLKQKALRLLQTSPEIRAIINKNPQMLTADSKISKIVKRELRATLDKYKNK